MATFTTHHLVDWTMDQAKAIVIKRGDAREMTIQAAYVAPTGQGSFALEATALYTGDPDTSQWSDVSDFDLPGMGEEPAVSGDGDFLIVYGGGSAPPIPGDALRLTWTPTPAGTTVNTDLLNVYVTRVVG